MRHPIVGALAMVVLAQVPFPLPDVDGRWPCNFAWLPLQTVPSERFPGTEFNLPLFAAYICCEEFPENEWLRASRYSMMWARTGNALGISRQKIVELADMGVTTTDIRLGPFWDRGNIYPLPYHELSNGRPDLSQINVAYRDYIYERIFFANWLGMRPNLDPLDCWLMKDGPDGNPAVNENDPRFWSAFYQSGVVQWDRYTKLVPPPPEVIAWVQYWAVMIRDSGLQVTWLTCNEGFASGGSSIAWEAGIAMAIKAILPNAVVGTNAQDPDIERLPFFNYAAYHWYTIPDKLPDIRKPILVNEHNGDNMTPMQWRLEAEEGLRRNVVFGYWRQSDSREEWLQTLALLKELSEQYYPREQCP